MSPLMVGKSGNSGTFSFPARAVGVLLCLVFILSGCGAFSSAVSGTKAALGIGPRPVTPDWKTLLITAAGNANANSAVAVDLVLVKDVAMLESLLTMSAAKWFAMRSDLQRTFPEALTVYPYELVPTQLIRMDEKQFGRERVWAALVFANYSSPGEHRARLLLNTAGYVVQLNTQSFNASEVKPGTAQ
jgi:type VI secretion system protein